MKLLQEKQRKRELADRKYVRTDLNVLYAYHV